MRRREFITLLGVGAARSELSPKIIERLGDSNEHLLDPFPAETEPFATTRALKIRMAAHLGDCIAVLVAAIRTTNNFDQRAFWQGIPRRVR
jgi:hypothetical protein